MAVDVFSTPPAANNGVTRREPPAGNTLVAVPPPGALMNVEQAQAWLAKSRDLDEVIDFKTKVVTAFGIDGALASARAAIVASRDPAGTLRRLVRFLDRERAFAFSVASLAEDDLIAARTGGARLQEFAASVRRCHHHERTTTCRPINNESLCKTSPYPLAATTPMALGRSPESRSSSIANATPARPLPEPQPATARRRPTLGRSPASTF